MEVCLVLGGGKVKVLGDDRLANLRLTAKQRDGTYRQLAYLSLYRIFEPEV